MAKQRIGSVSDVKEGESKMYNVNGQPVGVFHVNGKWFAISDKCSHRGTLLHEGPFDEYTVTCPLHGAQFDLKTGQNLSPPATMPVRAYVITAEGNDLFLEI